jgi:hypothetical protein
MLPQLGALEVTMICAAPPRGKALSDFIRIGGVVVDEQEAVTLVAQSLHHRDNGRFLRRICSDATKPHAETDEIGAHRGFGFGSNPSGRAIIAPMTLGISRR